MTETAKPRKRTARAGVQADDAVDAPPAAPSRPKPKPGEKGFDWQSEYPGEEVFVFTASTGLTIGMTKLGPTRRPKPGKLALLEDEEARGIKTLWYFLKLASSDASRQLQAELEEEDYAAMTREWAEFAGIELGE
ncbi:hypothetical protein [Mycobacterium intracellulare]|uniref:hypothetical protein n=1 Tax=Mycobacterium intracellulare TaxID=1767 RepID=UPI00080BF798|nr:hypothetical protein [Mycobacterium intracellulare]OCB15077.1 hypothetical protein A5689_26855 [Mycobacterium intracellulare subsp. yongonense]